MGRLRIMKIGFLINPSSGGGQGQRIWEKIRPLLKRDQLNYCAYKTSRPGQVSRVCAQLLRQNVDRLAIIGGDGTINESVQVLMTQDKGVPIAIIPAGTGNDLARTIDATLQPQRAYHNLLHGTITSMDVMEITVTDHVQYALNYFGIGLDAYVARLVYHSPRLRRLRRLGYLHAILDCWSSFVPFDLTVEADGTKMDLEGIWLFALSNLPFYATMPVNPHADYTDGSLEVNVIPHMSKLDVAALLLEARAGIPPKGLIQSQAREVIIHGRGPITAQIDGNPVELPRTIEIRNLKQALPIIMP